MDGRSVSKGVGGLMFGAERDDGAVLETTAFAECWRGWEPVLVEARYE